MRVVCLLVAFALHLPLYGAGAACSAGAPLLTFQLAVQPQEESQAAISVRSINQIQPEHKIVYAPMSFRKGTEPPEGKLSLLLVPADPGKELTVLDPHPARATAEWKMPFRPRVVALAYGPNGLSTGKVLSLVKEDQELIEQLADYAEQTAKAEQLIDALGDWDRTPSATESLNAALQGFSATYGRSIPQLNWKSTREQQVATTIQAVQPALTQYDPLAPEPQKRMQQSALLASSVAGLFLGSPVGLAAGGAAMMVNLGGMMFPNTNLRSSFVQQDDGALTLCAKREKHQSRTRLAYLWAVRVPDAEPPGLSITGPNHVLARTASKIKVRWDGPGDWRLLSRANRWRLVADGRPTTEVRVRPLPEDQSLELDLRYARPEPGKYKLAAAWDWDELTVDGEIEIHEFDSGARPVLAGDTADRLVASSGRVEARVVGCDFEFVEKVELSAKDGATAVKLEYELPEGAGEGPQKELTVRIDTDALAPGRYTMAFHFPGDQRRDLPIRILPPHPQIEGLPLRANLAEHEQRFKLEGSGLDRIEGVECDQADVSFENAEIELAIGPEVKRGDRLDLGLRVEGVASPVVVPDAVEVIGPRPQIRTSKLTLPDGLDIELREGELPTGSFASFALHVEPVESPPTIRLECAESELALASPAVRLGENHATVRLRGAGTETLFLSLDPGTVGASGCTLTATVSTEAQGASDPFTLGTVIRFPRIEKFSLSDEEAGWAQFEGQITGEDLELIERVGWDAEYGVEVTELPVPVAGSGHRQTLKVALPWPSPTPHAPLYIWLRDEATGRATTARY